MEGCVFIFGFCLMFYKLLINYFSLRNYFSKTKCICAFVRKKITGFTLLTFTITQISHK